MRDTLLYACFQSSCNFVPDSVDVCVVFCHRLECLVKCCHVFLHAGPSSLFVEGDFPWCFVMGGRAKVKLKQDSSVFRYAGHCSYLMYFAREVC